MNDNEIDSLPPEIGNLINLEELDVSKNGKNSFDNIKVLPGGTSTIVGWGCAAGVLYAYPIIIPTFLEMISNILYK